MLKQYNLACGTMFWGDTYLDSVMGGGVPTDDELKEIASVLEENQVRLIDTAEGYGFGDSERRVGQLARSHPSLVVMTKFMPTVWRWTRGSFFSSLERSTERLGRVPDVYFVHTPVHPLFEMWVSCAFEAKQQGLIKAVGLSNCSYDDVVAALRVAKRFGDSIAANQVLYSLIDYGSASLQKMERLCKENNISIIAYNVLGQGLLTDKLTRENYSSIRAAKMLRGLTYDRLAGLRATIQDVAKERNASMAAVCINWTACKGAIPLVGLRTPQQTREACAALVGGWRLTPDQVARLDAQALDISTLDKPRWKRLLFVLLISLLMMAYRLTRWLPFRRARPPQKK